MNRATAYATWKSIWRSIYPRGGQSGNPRWDWPTLRITYPQRAAMLMRCKHVLDTTTLN